MNISYIKMIKLTQDLLEDINQQIAMFQGIQSTLAHLIVKYYESHRAIVDYVSKHINNLDKTVVQNLKNDMMNVMSDLLEQAQSQNDDVYMAMSEMTKDTYDTVNMLCEYIGI